MTAEKETCITVEGLFETLSKSLNHNTMKWSSYFNSENYTGMMKKM